MNEKLNLVFMLYVGKETQGLVAIIGSDLDGTSVNIVICNLLDKRGLCASTSNVNR